MKITKLLQTKISWVITTGIAVAVLAVAPGTLHAADMTGQDRGMWFWQAPSSPYGSTAIVGHQSLENQAINNFKKWRVTTLYGSYDFENTDTAALAAWNKKLSANGITSYVLFADTSYLSAAHWPETCSMIMKDFVMFNRNARPAERFAGVAFDVEPHTLDGSDGRPSWKDATPQERRDDVEDMVAFLGKTRTFLDQNGEKSARMQTSLTNWYFKLDGKIGWKDAADRDQWFTELATLCDRVSIMDFEIPSADAIVARSSDEVQMLHGKARIALRANLGQEWKNIGDFWTAASSIEATTHQSIDIQAYAQLSADQASQ